MLHFLVKGELVNVMGTNVRRLLEDGFTCGICTELYDSVTRCPMARVCGHMLCLQCSEAYPDRCPMCEDASPVFRMYHVVPSDIVYKCPKCVFEGSFEEATKHADGHIVVSCSAETDKHLKVPKTVYRGCSQRREKRHLRQHQISSGCRGYECETCGERLCRTEALRHSRECGTGCPFAEFQACTCPPSMTLQEWKTRQCPFKIDSFVVDSLRYSDLTRREGSSRVMGTFWRKIHNAAGASASTDKDSVTTPRLRGAATCRRTR